MIAVYYLAWAIAVVLLLVGLYALIDPHALARHYGVSVEGHRETAWVRATGVRDVAFGIVLAAIAYLHLAQLLVVFSVVGIVVAIVDLWIVSRHGGHHRLHAAHAVHASGIVAFILVVAMALFAIGR